MYIFCTAAAYFMAKFANNKVMDTNDILTHDILLPGKPTLQLTFDWEGFGESISVNPQAGYHINWLLVMRIPSLFCEPDLLSVHL